VRDQTVARVHSGVALGARHHHRDCVRLLVSTKELITYGWAGWLADARRFVVSDARHHTETALLAAVSAIPYVGGPLALVAERTIERSRSNVAETGVAAIEEAGDPELFLQRVSDDERLAYMLLNAAEAAERTSLAAKRRLLGRVVGRAARDPAPIDESDLFTAALRDLDAPHLRVLAELEKAFQADQGRLKTLVAKEVMDRHPAPIAAALRRHGLVNEVATWDYAGLFDDLTDFGRKLLDDLRRANADEHTKDT
jgi:hypothetical protein